VTATTATAPPTTRLLRGLAVASLASNIGIVVTGGVVRLTGSGLGCPTWPRCSEDSLVPHDALGIHGVIEFGNRTLTFVLAAIAIATFVVALRTHERRFVRPALILGLGIPAQALLGGVTVLTDLNPWVVAGHMLLSLAMIQLAVLLVRRAYDVPVAQAHHPRLAWATFITGWSVLYIGTVVTGSGPNAGDEDAVRNGLDPDRLSQLHADAVFLLLGLSLAWLLMKRDAPSCDLHRASVNLAAALLLQGLIGFAQYFNGLPTALVTLHLLGSALIAALLAWQWLAATARD
jgi:cytochrome c oxidase assembly protein subunit 15